MAISQNDYVTLTQNHLNNYCLYKQFITNRDKDLADLYGQLDDVSERYNKRNVFWRIRQGLVLLSYVLCIFRAGKRQYKSGDKRLIVKHPKIYASMFKCV